MLGLDIVDVWYPLNGRVRLLVEILRTETVNKYGNSLIGILTRAFYTVIWPEVNFRVLMSQEYLLCVFRFNGIYRGYCI